MINDWIVHLCERSAWQNAVETGAYHPPSLTQEGFIHASRPEQVLEVANAFYRNSLDPVLLWINPQELLAELRWEQAGETIFPHIYGPLNLEAVRYVTDTSRDQDNTFIGQQLLPGD